MAVGDVGMDLGRILARQVIPLEADIRFFSRVANNGKLVKTVIDVPRYPYDSGPC